MYDIGADNVKLSFVVTDGGSVEAALRTYNVFAFPDNLCIGSLKFELLGSIQCIALIQTLLAEGLRG